MDLTATPETQSQQLDSFTSTLKHKLAYHEKSMRRVDRYLSTGFNVFRFIAADENLWSDILRDLLDPQGSHGQGDTFLRQFLDLRPNRLPGELKGGAAAVGELVGLPKEEAIASARVNREVRTRRIPAELRRMDLLIEIGARAIGIENKLGAADQKDQVQAYTEHLDNDRVLDDHRSNWLLIYLTPHGVRPTEASIALTEAERLRADGHLIELSYSIDIRGWLERCSTACESDKYRWFLRDFRDHIVDTYPSSSKEISDEQRA